MTLRAKWIAFFGFFFFILTSAAPFCSELVFTITEIVWTEAHSTITVSSRTLASKASVTDTSQPNHNVPIHHSSALTTSKALQSQSSLPFRNGFCSESEPCTGDLTYFDTATDPSSPGACGTTNDGEIEFVLALPRGIMEPSDCGKSVRIEYSGKTEVGKVVDKCNGCSDQSIDLSRALFREFSGLEAGRLFGAVWFIEP